MIKSTLKFFSLFCLLFLVGCAANESIVNNIDEREANEIVVYLASKGIPAQKVAASTGEAGGGGPTNQFNIAVSSEHSTDAMAYLNRVGLPRVPGTNLLTLFAKSGLMSSDFETTVRYQAGLAEEIKNTILKIDGVIDANVQISFPPAETGVPGAAPPRVTAAIYVKHLGILEDPNMHLETKIKRLVSSSINNLAFDDVSVISDRARMADIQLSMNGEAISPKTLQENYVSIWSIVMTKSSLSRFRFLFFLLILLNLAFAAGLGWMVYRFYPELLKKKKIEESTSPPPGV